MARKRKSTKRTATRRKARKGVNFSDDEKLALLACNLDETLKKKILKA